jgi:MoaA/NifB/PqqE/SkfB family radical SAM enzyme
MTLQDDPLLEAISRDKEGFACAVRKRRMYRPLLVTIAIVRTCNNRCVMCNDWRRDTSTCGGQLTRTRLLALLEELAALGTLRVNWSGGEPTICRDLPELVGRLRTLGIKSKLTTNGTLMTEQYAGRLREAGLAKAVFSIESARPAIHDRVVGVHGAWEKLVMGIRWLRPPGQTGLAIQFHSVLTAFNTGPELLELVPLAASLGVSRMTFARLYDDHLGAEERPRISPSAGQVAQFREDLLPRLRVAGRASGVTVVTEGCDELPGGPGTPERAASCYLPFYQCTIDRNGDVAACCILRDGPGRFGNLKDRPLAGVLDSERAIRLRRNLITGRMPAICSRCSLRVSGDDLIEASVLPSNGRAHAEVPAGPTGRD